ncbi:hypothetical protein THAOC_01062 [Thalassiosira oceanica]|uniref:RING-type domain-containing protein n=1 Tax=Thalassiosira oceanica TaxID=159749 RepID=K0TNH1_THAOC|nr:hypothetical protein THAOC_01062 [Thalassiosira oceanica]|eukprot:EJK77126.1 hypothetical protein THAOC_01062 [Thalassiosira oceanica]
MRGRAILQPPYPGLRRGRRRVRRLATSEGALNILSLSWLSAVSISPAASSSSPVCQLFLRRSGGVSSRESTAGNPPQRGATASNNEEQHGPNGDADQDDLNRGVRTSSSWDGNGVSESLLMGERKAGENARDDGAAASTMPPLPNLPELDSESGSSGLPPSATRMSDSSDQEDLIQPDETFAADAEADRVNRKPGSFLPDSVPNSGQNGGDDETVCTAEDQPEECNKETEDLSANVHGALLARIRELEAADRAKNERIKASEAMIKTLEAENCALKKSLADAEAENTIVRNEVKRNNVIVKVKQEASKENAELLAEVKDERDDAIEGMMALETAVKVKQEVNGTLKRNLADVEDKLDVAIEEREGLYLGCLQLQELAQNAIQENEEVRREARRKLANATTEQCMWPNCHGNRGSQRNILMGCGHVVCYDCIEELYGVDHILDDPKSSEPYMLSLRGYCACKVKGCTKKSGEALILNGRCPPA